MMDLFLQSLKSTIEITLIILVLMIIIEALLLRYQERMLHIIKKNKFVGYITSSFFGIIPGCLGTFAMDSLYMTGLLGFGGIVAVMVATSGDEAFLLLGMASKGEIPWLTVIFLISILFVLGIMAGIIADIIKKKSKMTFCTKCEVTKHEIEKFNSKHFLKEHVYDHILKKHIWQVFLWLFAAIFIIDFLRGYINLETLFSSSNMLYLLIIVALVGILPISGPNVFLLVLFSKGLIPFSLLLTNSIIQDGHGLLPIIGFSFRDALKIKIFNFVFGLLIGGILLLFGV